MNTEHARTYKEFTQDFQSFIEEVHREIKQDNFIEKTLQELENDSF